MGKSGRPSKEKSVDVYNALLEGAERCFRKKTYSSVSIREISAEAGVNSAMIHHYFGNKEGLYKSLLLKKYLPLIQELEKIERLESPEIDPVEVQMRNVTELLIKNRWIMRILLQEVLCEGAPLREFFVENIVRPLRRTFINNIRKKIEAGVYRDGLEPVVTGISVMSMVIFPHIIVDVLSSDPAFNAGEDLIGRLMRHNLELFRKGCRKE